MTALAPLAWLGRHATVLIALSVFVGLAVPPLARLLEPYILFGTLLPFLVALIQAEPGPAQPSLRATLFVALAVAWSLLASPLLVALALRIVGLEGDLAASMIAAAACPPLMAAAALALLLGLEVRLTLIVTVAASALMPFTFPLLARHLAGLEVALPTAGLVMRLLLIVAGTFLLAHLLRRVLGPERIARAREPMAGLAVVGLVVFAVGVMGGVDLVAGGPGPALRALLAAVLLNVGLQALTVFLCLPLGRHRALTLGLVAGNNNVGLVLGAMVGAAPPGFALFVAMAQFPIYLLPWLQQPLYRRLLRAPAADAPVS